MKYVLAVSGGVDSVVLLDKVMKCDLINLLPSDEVVVAHFDHGIREESSDDAKFVQKLAKKYGVDYILGKAKLGAKASEDDARRARYEFLRSVATGSDPVRIVTAHHQDDLVETIVMNILRGTGWRGLAPFWSEGIIRPLIDITKVDIVQYAIENDLKWVEDETNYSEKYFRNRIRSALDGAKTEQKDQLIYLYNKQAKLRAGIEEILSSIPVISGSYPVNVKQLTEVDEEISTEILNKMTDGKLTSPQLERLLKFVKDSKTGDICQPGAGMQITKKRGNMIALGNLR